VRRTHNAGHESHWTDSSGTPKVWHVTTGAQSLEMPMNRTACIVARPNPPHSNPTLANRKAPPFKQILAHAARVMGPSLVALSIASMAHAQGTMDFSGAQTLRVSQPISIREGKESPVGLIPWGPAHAHSVVSWLCGIFVVNTADWARYCRFCRLISIVPSIACARSRHPHTVKVVGSKDPITTSMLSAPACLQDCSFGYPFEGPRRSPW
jgi:hypothetical protein